MRWCDLNPSVIRWNSEGITVPYWSEADQKNRRYFVDFVIQLKSVDGEIKSILIEIKPDAETKPPSKRGRKKESTFLKECYTYQVNQDKWRHAQEWAKKNGMEFRVLTEYDLGIKK